MALEPIEAAHLRVTCDLPVMARVAAVRKFKAAGWHNDPGEHARTRTLEQVQRDGGGRWYCPACARRTHL